jgi:hypothetical protein
MPQIGNSRLGNSVPFVKQEIDQEQPCRSILVFCASGYFLLLDPVVG